MKIDPDVDYRGMIIHMDMPMQALPGSSFAPTALQMRIDLLKAQIDAATDVVYTPSEMEYQRRLRESAQFTRRPR